MRPNSLGLSSAWSDGHVATSLNGLMTCKSLTIIWLKEKHEADMKCASFRCILQITVQNWDALERTNSVDRVKGTAMSPVTSSRFQIPRICTNITSAFLSLLLVLAVCFGASRIASAQTDVGYILGTVTDPTGAAVSGGRVTITWQSTGLSSTVLTNETGYYTSQPLQVGQYSVSVTVARFCARGRPQCGRRCRLSHSYERQASSWCRHC